MTEPDSTKMVGKNHEKVGITPSIALINPKFPRNIGSAIRIASCYGINQVWTTGERWKEDNGHRRKPRLPREERIKGYKEVDFIEYDKFIDLFPKGTTPVAVEVRENSENLFDFEHPENPLYIFGPEDGSIPKVYLQHCHRFVVIPLRHCLNLATAIGTVLYDRQLKLHLLGATELVTPGEWEQRGSCEYEEE